MSEMDANSQSAAAESDFEVRIGTTVLEEFALNHSPADVLRELVQNEYDAGGLRLEVHFGIDALTVTGSGRPIDSRGWQRLSVLLGTGDIAGHSGQHVVPKANGVGSKNFGLRALFLFGDRIFVSSAGRMTMLDRRHGSLQKLRTDAETLGKPGVIIRVPYRAVDDHRMNAFSVDRERDAFESFGSELAGTLIKLASPGTDKGLRAVLVSSARLGHELHWEQKVRIVDGSPGTLRRSVRVTQVGTPIANVPGAVDELEFNRAVQLPPGHRDRDMPRYFKVRSGRIKVGISFPVTRRGKLDLSAAGTFFYPLGATRSRTGFPFSVSAPFHMNEDRSQLVGSFSSDWNAWLLGQSADVALGLLETDLFDRFGAESFLAFDPDNAGASTDESLVSAIREGLRTSPCWPSASIAGRRREPAFQPLSELTAPASPSLEDIATLALSAAERHHQTTSANRKTLDLINRLDGTRFTVNSLIRLWCAGSQGSSLETQVPDNETKRYFKDFPAALTPLKTQLRLASALERTNSDLNARHRADLKRSPVILTAANVLAAPDKPLWVAPPAIAGALPHDQVLHPSLESFNVLRGLCRPYDASKWVIASAERITQGRASDSEIDALTSFLRSGAEISKRAWAVVRKSPFLPDHRGMLAAPADMVIRGATNARYLAPALSFVRPDDARNPKLKRLGFRTEVSGADLVRLAHLAADGHEEPRVIAEALERLPRLLTPRVIADLREISFLPLDSGALVAPAEVYQPSKQALAILGPHGPFAVGYSPKTLAALKCLSTPSVDDILEMLNRRRASGEGLGNGDLVYRALFDAARMERRRSDEFREQQILWTGARWETPSDCLVANDATRILRPAVTLLPAANQAAYTAFGARSKPDEQHWCRLFEWIAEQGPSGRQLSSTVVQLAKRVYLRLDAAPSSLPSTVAFLLDDRRRLHRADDAARGSLLIDDDPLLASAIRNAEPSVSFVESADPRLYTFYRSAGVRPISEIARAGETHIGEMKPANPLLRADRLLALIKEPYFAAGMHALVFALRGASVSGAPGRIGRRLKALAEISLVSEISLRYKIRGMQLDIPAEFSLSADKILVAGVQTQRDLRSAVAGALAQIADDRPDGQLLLRDALYVLLECRSRDEMRRALASRRITWTYEHDRDDAPDGFPPDDPTLSILADALADGVLDDMDATDRDPDPSNVPAAPLLPIPPPAKPAPRRALPDLEEVQVQHVVARNLPQRRSGSNRSGNGGGGAPRSESEVAADRELGRQGEQIVLREIRAGLSAAGLAPELATWVSEAYPTADHDIRVTGPDGTTTWVEVKATTGRDGQFTWPRSEFRLALKARENYVLYRVYEADTLTPTVLDFRDPIGLLRSGELELNLDSYNGDVGRL